MRKIFGMFAVAASLTFAVGAARADEPSCRKVAELSESHVTIELCQIKQATSPAFKLAINGCDGALIINRINQVQVDEKGTIAPAAILCSGEVVAYVKAHLGSRMLYAERPNPKAPADEKDRDIPDGTQLKATFMGAFSRIYVVPTPK